MARTKLGLTENTGAPAGGQDSKSRVHCHFACRNGSLDEFGISLNNPTVLDISHLVLQVQPEYWKHEDPGKKRGYDAVFMQYMLHDETQIQKLAIPTVGNPP